jgi:hypothetical protein
MGYRTKHARGLCCFFGCSQRAAVRYSTPGQNKKDHEEQLFCPTHWEQVTPIPGDRTDPMRVRGIEDERRGAV